MLQNQHAVHKEYRRGLYSRQCGGLFLMEGRTVIGATCYSVDPAKNTGEPNLIIINGMLIKIPNACM